MTALDTLCQTERLTVAEYHCDRSPAQRVHEEASHADEFVFVVDGVFRKAASDGDVTLDASRVATFRKNQPYCISHPVTGGDRSIIVAFDVADLCTAFAAVPDASGSVLQRVPAAMPATPALIRLSAYLRHAARRETQDTLLIEEIAYAILDGLRAGASRAGPSATASRVEKPLVPDIAALVASRYRQKLSVGRIAQELRVSPFHLCRSFRAATGTTIHRYLTTLRMNEAAQRLWCYRNHLTELALDLGYSSHSHFSATFRQFFGITPVQMLAGPASPLPCECKDRPLPGITSARVRPRVPARRNRLQSSSAKRER